MLCFMFISGNLFAQSDKLVYDCYTNNFDQLISLQKSPDSISFARAVFITENAYYDGRLDFEKFLDDIKNLAFLSLTYAKVNKLSYSAKDSSNITLHGAIFKVMTDSFPVIIDTTVVFHHIPFTYDFNDIWGDSLWENMFITKLLVTHEGNCHSLPFLYKMIAELLGLEAHLALAPNHIYIKTYSEKFGWYNTELTSGMFPIDAWLVASGYIHLTAIQNGVYMKALDNRQSIAICMTDLAEGYKRKTKKADDDFIIRCCDSALYYFPNYVNALLLKAETLKAKYETLTARQPLPDEEQAKRIYDQMEQLYYKAYKLGYRTMPKDMYLQWMESLPSESEKYSNKHIIKIN